MPHYMTGLGGKLSFDAILWMSCLLQNLPFL